MWGLHLACETESQLVHSTALRLGYQWVHLLVYWSELELVSEWLTPPHESR